MWRRATQLGETSVAAVLSMLQLLALGAVVWWSAVVHRRHGRALGLRPQATAARPRGRGQRRYVASAAVATAALVGPTLGGVFSDTIGWRWIFFVNLPLGAAAAWVLWRRFDENVARKRHRIDYLGSSLLAVGGTLLLLALLEGGVEWAWDSALSILLFAGAAVVLVGFVTVERVAAEPVLKARGMERPPG